MPTYIYKCVKCDEKYEVFSKSSEFAEDILCPSCGSEQQKRVMTAANFATVTTAKSGTCGCGPSPEEKLSECICGAN
jgi:putative FmdB family regulatory protein